MGEVFFSMSTDLYLSEIEKRYRNAVENAFPLDKYVIRLPSDYMKEFNNATFGMERHERDKWISRKFLEMVDKCDVFVYTNIYSKDGNILFTKCVRNELSRAIELGKDIYRLYVETGKIILQKMDKPYFDTIVNSCDYSMKGWVLKSVDDYIKYYKNNKEALVLINDYFQSKIGVNIVIPHRNYVYEIENYGTEKYRGCKKHKNERHSIILPRQEFTKLCPYTLDTWNWTEYNTIMLNPFPKEIKEIRDLISRTRTLHKLMYCLDKERKCDYSKEGIATIINGKIAFADGSPIKDYNKIVGIRPIFDIDIKNEYKQSDAFFKDSIFNEYERTLELFLKYYELDEFCRIMFSGNGLYIDLGEHKFDYFDCDGFDEFDAEWRLIRKTMQKLMDENGINKLQIEKGYGWNRYFKAPFGFHAKSERISIPLNINERLDKKWMNDITKIELGLDQNVSNDIVKRAGNNWR